MKYRLLAQLRCSVEQHVMMSVIHTDGFRLLCHQFFPSSLLPLENCIKRCNTLWQKMTYVREALLLFSSSDDQGRNTRDTVFLLNTGRWWCSVWWSRRNRCAPEPPRMVSRTKRSVAFFVFRSRVDSQKRNATPPGLSPSKQHALFRVPM